MAQRKTDSRPPSQPSALLLLPPSEMNFSLMGVDGSSVPSLLTIPGPPESTASHLFPSDDEADVDSFVGQNPVSQNNTPFSMFQPLSHDPFSDVKLPKVDDQARSSHPFDSPHPPSVVPSQFIQSRPIPQPSPVPVTSHFGTMPDQTLNFTPTIGSSLPPKTNSTPHSMFRMTGKPQYAPPPDSVLASNQSSVFSPSNLPANPSPFSTPTYNPGASSSFDVDSQPYNPRIPPSTSFEASNKPAYSTASSPMSMPPALPGAGVVYSVINHHWFYCTTIEEKDVWLPFSVVDSQNIEESYKRGSPNGQLVSVEGGRYEIDVQQRVRTANYWIEVDSEVRRCLWFYRPDGENRFIPYEEQFSDSLEESYKNTLESGDFHKRLVFPGGETVVIHSPQVIVHFPASAQPDAWGNTTGESRPQVVKRGVADFDDIPEGESNQIDHLILVVLGIASTCDLRFRSMIECVSDFRSVSGQMLKAHFGNSQNEGRIGRVEFLPIKWNDALQKDVTKIDRNLKSITLGSIGKLRHFTNDTLLDLLFYRSPSYAQDIAAKVGKEINDTVGKFLSRNPSFKGGISLVGHGIGSLIVYDLLINQKQNDEIEAAGDAELHQKQPEVELAPPVSSTNSEPVDDTPVSLEGVLAQLGLRDFTDKFIQEQIDLDALSLCDDSDIKEMGIPLGPRKKLQGFLKEFKETQAKKKLQAETKAHQEAVQKQQQEARTEDANLATPSSTSTTTITYDAGSSGIGIQVIRYPHFQFQPKNFFALGSPVALMLALRGIECLGEEFRLPTCPAYFNIYHPFDPMLNQLGSKAASDSTLKQLTTCGAYRIEPLVLPNVPMRSVLIPHHKGRKRLHLELKESLTRIGYDLKQKIIDSVKSTWKSINSFAASHMAPPPQEDEMEREVDNVLSDIARDVDEGSVVTSSVADESDLPIGNINQGRRVDFVLQEKPIEMFNDYLFALASSSCYWQSEDTVLLMLKEIYLAMGVVPQRQGKDIRMFPAQPGGYVPPPPRAGFVHTGTPNAAHPAGQQMNSPPMTNPMNPYAASSSSQHSSVPLVASTMPLVPPGSQVPPTSQVRPSPYPIGPPPTMRPFGPPSQQSFGPPPLSGPPPRSGFMKMQ